MRKLLFLTISLFISSIIICMDNMGGMQAADKERNNKIIIYRPDMAVNIHQAAKKGGCQLVQEFLDEGTPVNACNSNGETPLHCAAMGGHTKVAELLLRRGADINALDNNGGTPFHSAAYYGQSNVVKLLLDYRANVNAQDKYQNTPLHVAACRCFVPLFKLLLDYRADLSAQNNHGETPLHFAASGPTLGDSLYEERILIPSLEEYREMCKFLLDNGGDPNTRNKHGETSLHKAAYHGRSNVVKLLLDYRADLSAQNNNGETPFDMANVWNNGSDWVELLRTK